MCIAGQYVIQQYGRQGCTADTILTTASECISAKEALNPRDSADVTIENDKLAPRGCYRVTKRGSSPLWYFNSHATGYLIESAEPVCRPGNAKPDCVHVSMDVFRLFSILFVNRSITAPQNLRSPCLSHTRVCVHRRVCGSTAYAALHSIYHGGHA